MQGKIDLRTVGRDNRDATIHDVHQDATSSPFRRSTDAVKKPVINSETKRKAIEELKPPLTKKTTVPTRRSTRISKTKTNTQQTLYDAFSRTRTTRTNKEDDKKRERDDHVPNEPSKKQRLLSHDETNNVSSNDAIEAPVPEATTTVPDTLTSSSSTIKDDNDSSISKKDDQHLQETSCTVDLPASPVESPEHRPLIRDTPSPLRELPPTPTSLGSTSRQKDIASTKLPKPISASQLSDKNGMTWIQTAILIN
ncbi:hypothetical protein K492DRAFT_16514 [Lichtheimia hyalospora FSU 10163]|nr:hypothetical protein K492DRAFT_16514 [Lichtheimia hyalospora FSU 10163]